jgi:mannose/fructose/N-acetylgalactosamine-specific phosphotransferase system component IIB
MKQLCYVSYLNEDFDIKKVVESIEKKSKVKNVNYGLTGKLIYSNEACKKVNLNKSDVAYFIENFTKSGAN